MMREPSSDLQLDREGRNALSSAINSYLHAEIGAFEFDRRIHELPQKDRTVAWAVEQLWYYYDDIKDHKVCLSKDAWDYHQRILLLLKSDAHVIVEQKRRWTWRQLGAALSVLLFLAIASQIGWGEHLFCVAIPFGAISIALSNAARPMSATHASVPPAHLIPFESLTQLLRLRRIVRGFRKRPYPGDATLKPIRGQFSEFANWLSMISHWVLFSPLVLAHQAFPERQEHVRVQF